MRYVTLPLALFLIGAAALCAQELGDTKKAAETNAPASAPKEKPVPGPEKEVKKETDNYRFTYTLEDVTQTVAATLRKLGLQFYGHFKLDMAHDSARTQFGDTAFYVLYYGSGQRKEEINIHARHTRFGVNWYGPEFEGIRAFGNFELDFIGKSLQPNAETRELQAAPRMRHAYMQFFFGEGWSLLAGQTWDMFAPVNMKLLNTLVGWGQGNIGFRRPQLTLAKAFKSGDSVWTLKGGAARPLARAGTTGSAFDAGENSGIPDFQAHLGFSAPLVGKQRVKLGVGGFVGWRKVYANSTNNLASDFNYTAYGGAVDFVVPILRNLDLLGEAWVGRGLDGYRAAVWQSVSYNGVDDFNIIRAWGAFANVIYKPHKRWRLAAGAGIDDPYNQDLVDPGRTTIERTKNTTMFGNVLFNFYKGASVGLEYQYMSTDYVAKRNRDNNRIQMSFMLKF